MKNRILILIAAAACLVTVSCSKQKPQAGQTKSANSSEAAVTLKPKWTPGKKIVQRLSVTSSSEMGSGQSKQGAAVQQVTDMTWDYSINTLKELDNGGHELELEFVASKLESKVGDHVYASFDSANDSGKASKDPFTPALRKLVGAKVRYTLGSDGKVERVDGYDDFMVRIARGSKHAEMLKSMFSEDALKQLCNWSDALPDHPVGPGDSWTYAKEMSLYGAVKLVIDGKFTFANWEDHNGHKCVKLDYDGTIAGKGMSAPFSMEKGKIHGSSWFDPEEGLAVASDSDETMTINIEQGGKTMKQLVRQNIAMTLVE
jgi:hypothetical protein